MYPLTMLGSCSGRRGTRSVELRVSRNARFYGRFMLQGAQGAAPSPAARLVAVTPADQVGAAFEAVSPVRV
ncbi:hypothetical protein [Streptomyces sp. NPDC014733]|uniref:hypothetical protein n=1 Tax=Streptomyces sp. NPDC014733 TaxID=3364885 RepID=UPI0036F95145